MATVSKAEKATLTLPDAPEVTAPPAPTWPQPCSLCKFYDAVPSLCRFNPPILTAGAPSTASVGAGIMTFPPQVSFWPKVEADDWCGQFIAAH